MLSTASRSVLTLATFVFAPECDRRIDISLLPPFIATGQEHDDVPSVPAKIYPIAWAEVDPKLKNAGTDGFRVGEISVRELSQGPCHASAGLGVEIVEPIPERPAATRGAIRPDFHRARISRRG
jgi:hypothetical protein